MTIYWGTCHCTGNDLKHQNLLMGLIASWISKLFCHILAAKFCHILAEKKKFVRQNLTPKATRNVNFKSNIRYISVLFHFLTYF